MHGLLGRFLRNYSDPIDQFPKQLKILTRVINTSNLAV